MKKEREPFCTIPRFPKNRWRLHILLLLVLSPVPSSIDLRAQGDGTSGSEARVKAGFIYNFARFIEWPQDSQKNPVRIAVLGRGNLASALEDSVRGKTVNNRPIEVTRLAAITYIARCEILVIERSESKRVREIIQLLAARPVLTVCDSSNCLKEGGMIGFQLVDDSVRFQINQEAADRAGLKISSQLMKVALPASGAHK